MTLNANFPGASGSYRAKNAVEGTERGLDALIGLVILLAGLTIGFLAVTELFVFAEATYKTSYAPEWADLGFGVAVFGGAGILLIATIVYLIRVVRGRRSWTASLWGTILMSAALVAGYLLILGSV